MAEIQRIVARTPTSGLVQIVCGLRTDAEIGAVVAHRVGADGDPERVLLDSVRALGAATAELNRRVPRSETW